MGRFGEAREVFKRIATTNGVELEHFRFEAEVIDKKDNGELMLITMDDGYAALPPGT